MKDSKYQKRIYHHVVNSDSNLIISAVAGSGKTTTLEKALTLIDGKKDIAFLAFNNAIVNELKSRIKRKDVQITTMHSFCWRILLKVKGYKSELKPNKAFDYSMTIIRKYEIEQKKIGYFQYLLSSVVHLMRTSLTFDIEGVIELADHHDFAINEREAQMCIDLLDLMDEDNHVFDFTDMIYRVVSEDIRLPKFDFIFVDESQDLSISQQTIISRIKKPTGRLIAVGDPRQAIYGFAGADVNSYERLKTLFDNTIELPLSVNYRCPKNVIKLAKEINPAIEAWEGSPDGVVRDGFISEIRQGDWVLCRNLKPLVLLNLYFLSVGFKSYVKGNDIGMGLVALINKIGSENTRQMLVKYDNMILKEKKKLISKGVRNPEKTEKIDAMIQKYDILDILAEGVSFTKQLKDKIRQIFKEQGEGICLSTIHKSKGLENNNVYMLCPELIPNKFAVQEWQLQQEDNLLYVAITRAKKRFITITDFEKVVEEKRKKK